MKPKKSLGQNFLIQPNIVSKIIHEAKIEKDETVLEVGPGRGILTRALLNTGVHVIAIEKDDNLFVELNKTFAQEIAEKKLVLVHDDILEFVSDPLKTTNYQLKTNGFSVVANIPYYITGELLRLFLSGNNQPKSMTLMLQKEVAKRICGAEHLVSKFGSETSKKFKESLLSLSVKCYGMPKYIATVGRGNFYPVPNVDSAILHISDISKNFFTAFSEEKFFSVLHAGFAHKRKLLIRNLEGLTFYNRRVELLRLQNLFQSYGLSENARAEELSLSDWGYLVDKL